MVVLVHVAAAGRGLIYTSASFSGQSDFVSQKFCICVNTVVTKSACPTAAEKRLSASICLCRRCRSQPLSSVSRKQRYNTLDFPTENRVPTGLLLAPIGNPEPKGLCPSGRPACPCSGDPSCSHTIDTLLPEQVKQAQRFARIAGKSLCLFWSAAAGKGERKALLTDKFELDIFVLRCENLLF